LEFSSTKRAIELPQSFKLLQKEENKKIAKP
jgi:hypothetical protein